MMWAKSGGRWLTSAVLSLSAFLPWEARAQGLSVAPLVRMRYDSNPLRTNGTRFRGPHDDVRISPGLTLAYNHTFGFGTVFSRNTLSYDKHTRFKFLDRENIQLRGGATVGIAGQCFIKPLASYVRSQLDLEDSGFAVSNALTQIRYEASLGCDQPAGFVPQLDVSHSEFRNSLASRRRANRNGDRVTATIAYIRPSLGRLDIYGTFEDLSRPNLPTVLVVGRQTHRKEFGARISRAVSSIIQVQAGVGSVRVTTNGLVNRFKGTTWDAELRISPIPSLNFTGSYGRQVRGDEGVGTAYTLSRGFSFSSSYEISPKTRLTVSAGDRRVQYFGEDPAIFPILRVKDHIRSISADVGYQLTRRLRLNVDASYRKRDNPSAFYDYDSTSVGMSLGGNF